MVYHILRCGFSFLAGILLRRHITGLGNVPKGACIVVANHVNLLDSPIIGVSLGRRVYFLAKEELFHSPVFGWLARQFGAFPVAKGRLDRRAGRKSIELLAAGQALIVYPEGRRSDNGCLGRAYPGAVLLAAKTGAPILPVGMSGTCRLTGKWWFARRPVITINIGQPFRLTTPDGKMDKATTARLCDDVMSHIAALLPPEQRGRY
jgi:1-acyl-sn-glycerol-3-phosphate acyltransferase